MPKEKIQSACATTIITHAKRRQNTVFWEWHWVRITRILKWNSFHWKSYSKNALRCFHKGKEESVSQIILWSYSCAAVEAPLVLMQRTHSHCRQIEWAKMYYFLEQSAFISFGCFQAFPELPEDVLRVHADVVQRSCLAQYNPSDNSQSAARCGEEGHLEGVVAHHCWTHTGDCLHVHRH